MAPTGCAALIEHEGVRLGVLMAGRQALACLLIALLAAPSPSYSSNPETKNPVEARDVLVGIFAAGRLATVRNAALLPGDTLFSGDTIKVEAKGGAWLAFGRGAQLELGAESEARLHKKDRKSVV